MKKKNHVNRAHLRYGTISAALLGILTAILIAVNCLATALEKRNGWRVDLSFNGITTQSDVTREALKDLPYPVHIYAMFSKGQEDAPLMELLDRYAAASDQITWEQSEPGLNPMLLARYSDERETVSSDSLIVACEETGRHRILSPADFVSLSMDEETGNYSWAGYTYERALTGAILYVTRDTVPRAVILQGHGELDGQMLSAFEAMLKDNHYDTAYEDLSRDGYTPDPADLLIFFSPQVDLTEEELAKITAFTDQGGSVLFTCDWVDPIDRMPNYAALLRSCGFVPREGIVVADPADPGSYYNNVQTVLIPKVLSTDVTMDLIASGADTLLLPGSRAFEDPGEGDRALMVSPVLQSGDTAWLKRLTAESTSMAKAEDDETGPFCLALQSRRVTQGGYVSRAFALGCSALLTEEQIHSMTDGRRFALRMMEFLLDTTGGAPEIPARDAVRPGLSARSGPLGSLMITALPMLVLLIALLVLLPRRNR